MKNNTLLILALCLVTFSNCKKTLTAPELRMQAAQKVIGKWMVDRQVEKVYSPLSTANPSSTGVTNGSEDDFYVFNADSTAEVYSAQNGKSVTVYEVINPYQIVIGQTLWRIEKLTENELLLVHDRNDGRQYKRFLTELFLKR